MIPCFQWVSPRKANSFSIPTTLRLFVGPSRISLIAARPPATKASSTPCSRSTDAIASDTRPRSVPAGASGRNTGSSVRSFTSSATCGRQNSAVANQSPSTVVDSSSASGGAPRSRSRSFLVPRTTSTGRVWSIRSRRRASPPSPRSVTTAEGLAAGADCRRDGTPKAVVLRERRRPFRYRWYAGVTLA